MKRNIIRQLLNVVIINVVVLLLSSCEAKLKDNTYSIDIVTTNDLHGKYFDSLYVDGKANQSSLANLSSFLKEFRESGADPILLDIGDHLQGDNAAFYYNFVDTIQPHIFSRVIRYLDYDAIVVGNHDIEAGHSVYDKVREELGIPYLAANALIEGTEESYFEPYTIIKRNGVKVAVIGMTNPNIPSWLPKDKWSGLEFVRVVPLAQDIVNQVIAKEKPHVVILAIHAGLGSGEESDFENEGRYSAKVIKGIDIVICAHDHREAIEFVDGADGNKVLLIDGSARAKLANKINVEIKVEKGVVVDKKITAEHIALGKDYAPDSEYVSYFKEDYKAVQTFTSRDVAEIVEDIQIEKALSGPSEYMTLIHKLQLASTGAQISFAAPLSSRGVIEKGVVNYQDLTTIYPFENLLYVMELSGKQIKDFLEYSYEGWINKSTPTYNYDSADGIIYNVYKKRKYGERVEIISMSDGKPFDMEAKYSVAINSYRASGGGDHITKGVAIPKDDIESKYVVKKYKDIRSLLFNYLESEKVVKPEINNNWKFVE